MKLTPPPKAYTIRTMKLLIPIICLMTGCTTVYKVDSKGVCKAPNGKIVNVASVNPDAFTDSISNIGVPKKYKSGRHFTSSASTWTYREMVQYCSYQGGTCYGW